MEQDISINKFIDTLLGLFFVFFMIFLQLSVLIYHVLSVNTILHNFNVPLDDLQFAFKLAYFFPQSFIILLIKFLSLELQVLLINSLLHNQICCGKLRIFEDFKSTMFFKPRLQTVIKLQASALIYCIFRFHDGAFEC